MLAIVLMFAYVLFLMFITVNREMALRTSNLLKEAPEGFAGRLFLIFLPPIILMLPVGLLIVWSLKRQSPREVEADERDKLIKTRAARAAFISAWIVLPVVSVIPQLVLGYNGCVPAWLLPISGIGVLVIVSMVHSAAILVQYGWKGKDNE
jgi:Na+/H+ antiporter NhaC